VGPEFRQGLAEQFICSYEAWTGSSCGFSWDWADPEDYGSSTHTWQLGRMPCHGIIKRMTRPVEIQGKVHRPPHLWNNLWPFLLCHIHPILPPICSFIRNHKDGHTQSCVMPRSYPGREVQPNSFPRNSQATVAEISHHWGAWVSHLTAAKGADSRQSNRIGF